MAYYLVRIEDDPARGPGLLALAGVQNIADLDAAPGTLTARLSAADGESAVQRVRAALEGESFTVAEYTRLEHGPAG